TEQFIPASDLIVFVFEAKNPYRQSAWDFFKYIHGDWRKKTIFVLQQKDLATENELEVNTAGVTEKARKEGIEHPNVFVVSAREEQLDVPNSGFAELREYIASNITGGRAPRLKLNNSILTAQTINGRIAEGLEVRRLQFEADNRFRADIGDTLDTEVAQSNKQVDLMVENLLLTYDNITREKEEELREGLSMFGLIKRSVVSKFGSTPNAKVWLEGVAKDLEQDLNNKLRGRLNEQVVDLAERIQTMVKTIDLKIRNSETILRNDHELFSSIAERRENILRDLQDAFNRFVGKTENFTDESLLADRQNLAPNLAAGGGVAALGVILMAMSSLPLLDVTGGILTTVGVVFTGFSTRGMRKRVITSFEKEIAAGREQLAQDLEDRLKSYIRTLRTRIEANFSRFDEMLDREEKNLLILEGTHREVDEQLDVLSNEQVK
ncbi:MAG: GTP-binding protein, partial [Lewinella sp.]